jgi:hypothetical protein
MDGCCGKAAWPSVCLLESLEWKMDRNVSRCFLDETRSAKEGRVEAALLVERAEKR